MQLLLKQEIIIISGSAVGGTDTWGICTVKCEKCHPASLKKWQKQVTFITEDAITGK